MFAYANGMQTIVAVTVFVIVPDTVTETDATEPDAVTRMLIVPPSFGSVPRMLVSALSTVVAVIAVACTTDE